MLPSLTCNQKRPSCCEQFDSVDRRLIAAVDVLAHKSPESLVICLVCWPPLQ
jgi:hypothetical protein